MRQLQPVIWSKGTFLSPQHLQAQEQFVEDSARFYLDSLYARSWGFREIQIDTKALSEGRLAITRPPAYSPMRSPWTFPRRNTRRRPGFSTNAFRMAGKAALSTLPCRNTSRVG